MSATITLIRSIARDIATNETSELFSKLSQLQLSFIATSTSEELISTFLDLCRTHDNKDAARIIIDTFNELRLRVDPLPALTNLFTNTVIDNDVLRFAVSCFPEKRAIDYLVDLVNGGEDLIGVKAIPLIETIFPDITGEEWLGLYTLTKIDPEQDEEDQYLEPLHMMNAYFETKAAENGSSASKPSWVKYYPQIEVEDVPEYLPSVRDAVDLILHDLENKVSMISDETNEPVNIKQELISQYGISTISEKIAMLSHVKELPQFDDTNIFREYGPVNSMYSMTEETRPKDHPCVRFGGCRMFTCNEFEFDEEEFMENDDYYDSEDYFTYDYTPVDSDTPISNTIQVIKVTAVTTQDIDWYKGKCEVCKHPIAKREQAVRMPLHHGAWKGCYCVPCLKKEVNDPTTALMVGRMLKQLEEIGIRDR